MDLQSLKHYWLNTTKLINYQQSQLNEPRLSAGTIEFLTECGLPESCAPFLTFENFDGEPLPGPNQFFGGYQKELENYLLIGSTGSGDPICIDVEGNDEIIYLNHDNVFERVFMNSSLFHLAKFIIRFEQFHESLESNINNVLSIRPFSDDEFAELKNDFLKTDEQALSENSFWSGVLGDLLRDRDNER